MLRPKAPLRYAARQAPLSLLVFFVHSTLISWARSNAVRTCSNIRFEIHDSSSLLRPQYGRLLHYGFPLSFISPPKRLHQRTLLRQEKLATALSRGGEE